MKCTDLVVSLNIFIKPDGSVNALLMHTCLFMYIHTGTGTDVECMCDIPISLSCKHVIQFKYQTNKNNHLAEQKYHLAFILKVSNIHI